MATLFRIGCCHAAPAAQDLRQKPESLKSAEEMRKAFVTAAIEWTAKLSDETEPRFYSNQFQSDRLLFASLGDSTGQQIPGADRSGEPFAFSAHQVLCEGGQRWSYTEEATTAE